MNINNLERFRQTIASGKTAIGAVVTLNDFTVSECAGDSGLDFIWIDAEHAPHTIDSVHGHIMACRGTGCAPFVRVAKNDAGILKPILDLAPAGVIIPMVNSAEEAEYAVSACKYPPRGIRGVGVRRANRYGADSLDDYFQAAQSEPLVIVQIEHVDAVRNLDAILKVPGIDSICIGPCDLSGSMNCLCQMDNPDLNQVIDEIASKTKKAGLLLGTASYPFAPWKKRGIDWMAMGGDCGILATGFRNMLKEAGRL